MNTDQKNTTKRNLIEWGVILAVILFLYFTGLHTPVLATLQRGLLATGLLTPSVPSVTDTMPEASTDFYFTDQNSELKSLADFRGEVVFLNVWATWCAPCIAEMPTIQSLYEKLSDVENISFVMVSMDEDIEDAYDFMRSRGYDDLPVYHYRSRSREYYDSSVIPTTYVITANGKLAVEKRGLAKYNTDSFELFMRELAGEN